MKSMKLLNLLTVASFFLVSCGGDSSGTIGVTLNIDALSSGEQSNIAHFVFIVAGPNSTNVLYPSSCVGTNGNESCILGSACGFTRDEDMFDPNISFDDFADGSVISVTACALDGSSGYIGAGSSNIVNSDGQTATITVNNTNACTGLPAVCP